MKFLLIDDDAAERSLTIAALSDKFADANIVEIDSCAAYVEKIDDAGFDLAIIDYRFGWTDGLTLFKAIRARYVGLPVIMLTGAGNEEVAVTAIKSGIADYIVKRNRHLLSGSVERSLLEAKERECRKNDNQFRLYERRDPFISRFTRDYAYFIRISPDGRPVFEWVSEQLKQLIDSAGAQAQDWILPVHPEDSAIVQDRFKRLLTGVEDTGEYRIVINEEDTRYFSDHSIPVRDLIDGKVIQLYGVMQDITARRKVEEKLYLMQHAIESSSNGIIITGLSDTDYGIIYANEAFSLITGYSVEEVVGQNCRIMQNGDQDQPGIIELRNALQNKRGGHAILRNYRKDKRMFWNEIFISPIHDRQGRITHYVGVLNDVTKRVEMEYALSQSEARMRAIFDNVSDGIIIIDENGIIEKLNPSAEKLFGYTANDLVGQDINKLMPESERSWHTEYLKNYLNTGRAKIIGTKREVSGLRQDGSVFPMELGVSEFSVDQRHFFIGTAHDITERKEAEYALRDLSGYLEAAREDERTRIAREIHDELGSLLTALKMDLSWLNKQLPEELVLCHGKIITMIRHLDDGIQTVRRIIADLRPSILDHLGLLAAIEWKLDEFREQSGIQYELTVPKDNIVMNENRDIVVFRIMQEALSNIAVHSGASKVTLDVATDANNLTMKITDNGCGMTKAQMHKPGKYGILGMHERARHFGGEVTITSQPGKGTTLVLTMHLQSSEGESRHD
ncbi:MAG: PAS domain S-box protein [Methylobacter sp.]